ncbi:MAG: hypothetical protein H7X95_08820, partial [Deltaproteobacteria bacterium]|nr:hypothetical protein [Deltaproteobacteria bacterium]
MVRRTRTFMTGNSVGAFVVSFVVAFVFVFVFPLLGGGTIGDARADQDDDDDPFAARAPVVHWRTLLTPHFRIHFYEAERYIAERAAGIAERAYESLTRYLNWRPRG